jgi:cytochrome-b5 reductase
MKDVIRPYTPISSNLEQGYFDLLVKVYPSGVMSKHFGSLKVGDKLDMKGPIMKISYQPNMKRRIGMIAGGTGITPMLQVIKAIVENPADKTEVNLLFANQSVDDILLRDQLDAIAKKHSNIKVHYLIDKPAPSGGVVEKLKASWSGKVEPTVGRVSEELIKQHLPAPSSDALVFVCGPPGMMNAISGNKDFKVSPPTQGELSGLLAKMGYQKDQVRHFARRVWSGQVPLT